MKETAPDQLFGRTTVSLQTQASRHRLTTLPKRNAELIEPIDYAPVSRLPDGSRWLVEIKLDGYCAIAIKAHGRVNLFSRRQKSFNHQYPYLVDALGELPEGTVVDGEVVALSMNRAHRIST